MDTYHDDSTYIFEEDDEPHCNGCLKQIDDGAVVQFGDGIWHIDCFTCTKCHKLVECYSNLLLLRDGRPICEECSYNCHACHKAIKDEAIMTGDEAYHAECFKCTQCGIKIEDLVFTQTSKLIPSPPRTSPSSDVTFKSFNSTNDDIDVVDALPPTSLSQTERLSQLERELQSTRIIHPRYWSSHSCFQTISRKALDEFHIVKESYNAEVAARQAAEAQVARLKAELFGYHQAKLFGAVESAKITKDEIAQLAQSKADLERTCQELRNQREALVAEVNNTAIRMISCFTLFSYLTADTSRERAYQAYQLQLRSIMADTEAAKTNFARMSKARDDIINEMIMLNTKNAELTTLNNDLSRRVTEREREALAVMAGTSFLSEEPSFPSSEAQIGVVTLERKSSEHQKTAQRDSVGKAEPAKMFKFRRNKNNNVFSRRNNSNGSSASSSKYHKKSNQESAIKGLVLQERARQTKRTHNFTQTRFLRPTKCDICSEKIWRASEFKCQDCGYVSHGRCLHHVPNQCIGRVSQDSENQAKPMFGNDLAEQVRLENGVVPMVVQTCIEAVEARGMDFEGIYRKSGAAGQMRQIQQAFDTADTTCDLKNENQWNDVCAITSVLKQYFRDLPNPLFTYEHHAKFMDAARATTSEQQHTLYQGAIRSLPLENYNTLKYLMSHLCRVCKHQKENLMTSKNLAVIFGPTLMRNRDESGDLLDMNCKISTVDFIISHFSTLFAEPQPSKENHSSPLPTSSSSSNRRNSLASIAALRTIPPALPPRENANYI
ncbi:hypothetical protein BX666DRAFT_1847422 [Dichotomocladium elegans]|nr:hypothetical protein BX666DRAFT_1847422 [Dichotomocladium elegans]